MKKPTLCVIFGGKSSEYEVSLRSAYAVLSHLNKEKYDVVRLGITKGGEWYIFEGENEKILSKMHKKLKYDFSVMRILNLVLILKRRRRKVKKAIFDIYALRL